MSSHRKFSEAYIYFFFIFIIITYTYCILTAIIKSHFLLDIFNFVYITS